MRIRHLRVVIATVALGLVAGCELIGGIEEIALVESGPDDAGADAPLVCDLPAEGAAFLRLGDLVPASAAYDFCIKPVEGSFDDVRPLLASGGGGCPAGLGYKDVTVAFRVEPGTYDVRMVPAGAQDCAQSEGDISGVEALDNRVTTVLAFSENGGGHLLSALPESPPAFNQSQMRFVHALVGYDALDCGATDNSRLPATILASIFEEVPFAGVSPAGSADVGNIDDNGYLTYSFGGGTARFGIAVPQQIDALATLATRFALGSSHSLFAVGRKGDAAYPPALWSCDEGSTTDGILAACGNPLDVSVEVFSTQLTDLFTPLYRARIEPVLDAIGKASSDVICINEMRSPKNLEALRAATGDVYPHRVISTDVTLADSDLSDQDGTVPPPYTTPACSGSTATVLQALMDCVDANCAQDDGTGQHHFIDDGSIGADCVASKCPTEVAPLYLTEGEQGEACWMCALTQMAGEESTETVRQACTEEPDARYAYRGSLGLAVLSKYPIGEATGWLLPSTGWQRGLLHVPVELPNGVPLDFYCGDLTVPVTGIVFPYVGAYGGDSEGSKRWVAEQLLQAQRVAEIVDGHTGGSGARVVLATTAYAGPEYLEGATRILTAQSPEVYEEFLEDFLPLVSQSYVPSCSQCLNNAVLSGLDPGDRPAADAWTSHLFGRGIAQDAVLETALTFTEPAYTVAAPEGPRTIPPSSQYGLRSVVRITQ